jgi:hypothetical protein
VQGHAGGADANGMASWSSVLPVALAAVAITGCASATGKPVARPPSVPKPSVNAPTLPDTPTASTASGCASAHVHAADDGPSAIVRPPAHVAFFARHAGTLPGTGSATIGGVALPPGRRCGSFWATDEPTSQAIRLAARLANVFPQTGLWPVLWIPTSGGPGGYVPGNPGSFAPDYSAREAAARVDRLDAATLLARSWARNGPPDKPFPGLAPGNFTAAPGRAAADPFGTLITSIPADESPPNGWVLMLVSCNRPADAVAVTGLEQSEVMPDVGISAVLRSWEERFGAIVTAIGPGELDLVVDRPPAGAADSRRLAAEQLTVAPDDDPLPSVRARLWEFGWPD